MHTKLYRFARLTIAVLSVSLGACSTPVEYQAYVAAHQSQAQAASQAASSQATADAARYAALSQIATSSTDPTTKVAAVMAIAMEGRGSGGQRAVQQAPIAAPVSNSETALRWAQVVVPGVTALYGIRANAMTAMNASDNAAATSASTNNAFVGLAGKIQAPAANVTTTTTTTNTLSGTGVLGTGTYTNTPVTTTSTVGGSGVIGSGTYSPSSTDNHAVSTTTDNHTTNPTTPGKVCSVDSTGVLTCQ